MGLFERIFSKFSRHHASIVIAPGSAAWTDRNYTEMAEKGFRQNDVVYACVSLLCEAFAEVPLKLEQVGRDGKAEQVHDNPAMRLLAQPNPTTSSYEARYAWAAYLLIAGNSYQHVVRAESDGGRPLELWPMRPDKTRVIQGDQFDPVRGYEYSEGVPIDLAADEVWHTKLFHPTSFFYGMSPMEAALRGVDQYNQAGEWNLATLQNGGAPYGLLNMRGAVSETKKKKFEEAYKEHMAGSANGRKTLVVRASDGIDYIQLALDALQMDWREGTHDAARAICRAYRVPGQMVGIPGDQTYANYEQANRAFYREGVLPLLHLFCQSYGRATLPSYDLPLSAGGFPGFRLTPDLSEVGALQEDRERLYKRVSMAFEKGLLTQREAKEELGQNTENAEDLYAYELLKPTSAGAQTRMEEASKAFGPRVLAALNSHVYQN